MTCLGNFREKYWKQIMIFILISNYYIINFITGRFIAFTNINYEKFYILLFVMIFSPTYHRCLVYPVVGLYHYPYWTSFETLLVHSVLVFLWRSCWGCSSHGGLRFLRRVAHQDTRWCCHSGRYYRYCWCRSEDRCWT